MAALGAQAGALASETRMEMELAAKSLVLTAVDLYTDPQQVGGCHVRSGRAGS
jgi:hypothetical protein